MTKLTRIFAALAAALTLCPVSAWAQFGTSTGKDSGSGSGTKLPPQIITAWSMLPPLGLHEPAPVDTLLYDYYKTAVPWAVSPAWASTGNLGAPGIDMIYMDRPAMSDFWFRDALEPWLPMRGNHVFYNSRIPMTLLSYAMGGNRDASQERLKGTFSGNVNKQLQIGAMLDYLYSKGSYADQAAKDMAWGFSGSYIGDRYQAQIFYNHYHELLKENGGITNDLYITDPAEVQGGTPTIKPKSIPTRLTGAHSRVVGSELMVNQRFNMGYRRELPDSLQPAPQDSLPRLTEFVPVSSIIWTFDWQTGRHGFHHDPSASGGSGSAGGAADDFWSNTYLDRAGTDDRTSYWSVTNTVGLSLAEGFKPWVKFGLAAFVTHEIQHYVQVPDSVNFPAGEGSTRPSDLTPYPYPEQVAPSATEHEAWLGGQLTKQRGRILRYDATARFGMVGRVAGDLDITGSIAARVPLGRDSLVVEGHGAFHNTAAPYLMDNYVSNHFIWHNDWSKQRRVRFGGSLAWPRSRTHIGVDVENVQNYLYFNYTGLPAQHDGNIQVLSAYLDQNLSVGILNWDNRVIWQKSSDTGVLPLPELTVTSNLYLRFKVARVLDVQFGVDCDYYTKYTGLDYQPATMAFTLQNPDKAVKVGGYPLMNLYANMKLSKARFYVLFSHVNQGLLGGNSYFVLPHYPMNPRCFRVGVSVDFAN